MLLNVETLHCASIVIMLNTKRYVPPRAMSLFQSNAKSASVSPEFTRLVLVLGDRELKDIPPQRTRVPVAKVIAKTISVSLEWFRLYHYYFSCVLT